MRNHYAIEHIKPLRGGLWRRWAWREWCFARVVLWRFGVRFGVLVLTLLIGASLFLIYAPESVKNSEWIAIFFTWSLIFGQPQGDLPSHPAAAALYFIVPVIGLAFLVQAIIDFVLLLRDRRRHEYDWCKIMSNALTNHIILIGLGKLGVRTFHLLRKLNENVVVIERNDKDQFLDDVRRDGAPLLIGDARREALLDDANVRKARSIILATNDDLTNLEIALDARKLNPTIRVVMRMFDQNMADKIRDGFNIHIAMSQSAMAAPAFATAAIDRANLSSMVVSERLVVMQRWTIGGRSPLCGKTVGDAMTDYGIVIVERRTPAEVATLFPPPTTPLDEGDELLIQGPFEKLAFAAKSLAG